MKRVVFLLGIIAMLALTAASQSVGEKKFPIAVVSTPMFDDPKTGIKKLLKAYREVEMSDCAAAFGYAAVQQKLVAVKKEIEGLRCQNKAITEKEAERIQLEELSRIKFDEAKRCKSDLRKNLVEPVEKEILRLLDQFVRLRGYTLLVEHIGILGGTAQQSKEFDDITNDFIEYCNTVFEPGIKKEGNFVVN